MSYVPISCEFHDLLEVHATTRRPTALRFRDSSGTEQARSAVITDVYARSGAEYLSMDSGETLRLDQLIEVAGVELRTCS